MRVLTLLAALLCATGLLAQQTRPRFPKYLPCGYNFDNESLQHLLDIEDGLIDPTAYDVATPFPATSPTAPRPWPRDSRNLVQIPYCYYDQAARDVLHKEVEDALDVWRHALGSPPSKETGHGVVFGEAQGLCTKPNGDWNKDVPFNTVPIHHDEGGVFMYSPVGLNQAQCPRPFVMNMMIGDTRTLEGLVHEFGHVLGK